MDYQLENLGPERFQEVCQALLVKAFPNVQCFPVAQPDGGRDAITYSVAGSAREFLVFQVKFVRRPNAIESPHKWLVSIIEDEAPKIAKLVPQGAVGYYLLTNVPGTAHPESGSIDSVDRILNRYLGVQSYCWWRNEINRRLDDSWNVKWSYPEVLSGPDVLRLLIESGITADRDRRISAITSFVRDQFEHDKEVRFKQVELQNNLLDLFIDVPVALREAAFARRKRNRRIDYFWQRLQSLYGYKETTGHHDEQVIGAATLLLTQEIQEELPCVVLEGAPGQGKSTIAQYICQIHRRRLLNESLGFPCITEAHKKSPVRLPFKVDLRDFAAWLSRKNPFVPADDASLLQGWEKSLESFLAAQVRYHSGGVEFSTADLLAIARISALLLVFDGLDEVAGITRRADVVEEITKGVKRLGDHAVSLQAIVTSRPAAFANSPGLPEGTFTYLDLGAIGRQAIDNYAERWLKAKRLGQKEAAEVRTILRNKLDQPHLSELARNPMQLAILLSLIHTRGSSLPDKRTALYDSYVELFFSREAEKSSVVRDHRDLLIDLHRYLAWTLHSEAETQDNQGSVTSERLRELVSGYLRREGHDGSIAERLFTGMIERVVALVSRVEGTFEFEVQPLREYFAARYLYDTAPYSPSGGERVGALPDRFNAIARNFYWQNVARFYAGCYSKGELSSLVDCLDDLIHSDLFKYTCHPHTLATTLLADWVFAQQPKSMRQVVSLVLDGIGLRQVVNVSGQQYRRPNVLVLPEGSGNEELVARCFELLRLSPPQDYADSLVEVVRANTSVSQRLALWRNCTATCGDQDESRWLRYGLHLGILSHLETDELERFARNRAEMPHVLQVLLQGGHTRFVEDSPTRCKAVAALVLEDASYPPSAIRSKSVIELLSQAIDAGRYARAFSSRAALPLRHTWRYWSALNSWDEYDDKGYPSHDASTKCRKVFETARELTCRSAAEWAASIEPWDGLVETIRGQFGENLACAILATVAAAIKSKTDKCESFDTLFDDGVSLCRRVRYARLRAGNCGWWESQLRATESESHIQLLCLVFASWAGPSVIVKAVVGVDEMVRELPELAWRTLARSVRRTVMVARSSDLVTLDARELPSSLSPRTAVLLSYKADEKTEDRLYHKYCREYDGRDVDILSFCQQVSLRLSLSDREGWEKCSPVIQRAYSRGAVLSPHTFRGSRYQDRGNFMPVDVAKRIVEEAEKYPGVLVSVAERICRQALETVMEPVGVIAERDGWFEG